MKKFLLIVLARCKVNFCKYSCSPAAARPLPNSLPQAGEGKKPAFLVHLIPSPACGRGQAALAARERARRSQLKFILKIECNTILYYFFR